MPKRSPTKYTTELGDEICMRLAAGESMAQICAREKMPARATIHRWLTDESDDDDPRFTFRERYAQAREVQADLYFDQVLEVAEQGSDDVQRDRLRVDALKWVLGRMNPRMYGDKVETTLRGDGRNPVQMEQRSSPLPDLSPELRKKTTALVQEIIREQGSD